MQIFLLHRSSIVLLLGLMLTTTLPIGCQRASYAEVDVIPVTGQLSVQGTPAHGAYLTFHPRGDVGMSKGNVPFARVLPDGTFQVTTYDTNDGIPQGRYAVTLYWPLDPDARGPSPDRFQGRFSRPEAPAFEAVVDETTTQLGPWDIK